MNKFIIISVFVVFSSTTYIYINQKQQNSEIIKWKEKQIKFQQEILKNDSINSIKEASFRDSIVVILNERDDRIDSLNNLINKNFTHEKRLENQINSINSIIGELPDF